jgi:ribosomal protein S18 acetylase RimI-like enzyme
MGPPPLRPAVHDPHVPTPAVTTAARLEPAERAAALASVVAAFATDPLLRWVWPEDGRYACLAPPFFGLLLDLRRAGGEVWTAGGGAAVAMWDPPGGSYAPPAEDPWPALQATFSRAERDRWAIFDGAVAVPAGVAPYWYLGVLATHPDRQRSGLARAAAGPVLAAADRTRTVAYLETATEANLGFYEGLGFAVDREVGLPDGGPRCWLMRREPGVTGG